MKKPKDLFMYLLGAIIVIAFFLTIFGLIKAEIPERNQQLLNLIIGALIASFSTIVNYFFGSSKGSADKTELMTKQNEQV